MSLLTNEEKSFLLRLARRSLESAVSGEKADPPGTCPAALRDPASAFVSLHKKSGLRGCVGYLQPATPLYRTVMEAAAAAALNDTRFPRVRPEELSEIDVEISVLSPSRPVRPEEIQVGVHGLVVRLERARGVLLPQVAVEQGWSRLQFLEQTCRKAGLSRDAWQHGATVQAFTAEVFGEQSLTLEEQQCSTRATPAPQHPRDKFPPG